MRHINSLSLAFILAGFIGCSAPNESETPTKSVSKPVADSMTRNEAEASKNGSSSVMVESVSQPEKPQAKPEVASAGEAESTKPAPAAKKDDWSAGDTIPSGMAGVPDIQILQVHKNGSGDPCGLGKSATLKYKAMLANGTVIDPGRRPFTFKVGAGRAIKGWDVVVSKMRVGDSFTITLPQQLAYGASKGDLKFDMELLSVK